MRIVDFSTHLSGPMASHLLAEAGADVIKVEHPVFGDGNRGMKPKIAGTGDFHIGLNSGVRSLTVSSRSPQWTEVIAACARWADAVLVGSRPSDARRRGLDFASLAAHNPRLVYCSISGYGLRGPWRDYPAHGQNVDALAGQVPIDEVDGRLVTGAGWRSSGTTLAGVFAALGVLAALADNPQRTSPKFVHVSLWHSAMWWKWRDLNDLANLGHPWPDYRDLGPRYSLYRTSDGRAVLVCPLEEKFWKAFCQLLDLPAEVAARGEWNKGNSGMDYGYDGEYDIIAREIVKKPRDYWTAELERLGMPFAPVLDLAESMESPHAVDNDLMRATSFGGQALRVVASPIQMHISPDGEVSEPLPPLSPAPEIGEQSAEILRELGLELDAEAIR
ncbi:MAG TPA: CaiB/BaiF CoA-transferase family protein [Amycolatopsis sp.]|nr:CaiB/BaiF CoA-transferase family protein [Amycolatopsis sp.]